LFGQLLVKKFLNGDVGGNFQGVQTTSGWFPNGVLKELQVKLNYIGLQWRFNVAIMLFGLVPLS
jgi:hypothetical protein